MTVNYMYLFVAIIAEVIGTTALARSDGFTRFGPGAITVVSYAVAFYCLSIPLRVMPTGIVYAIWSGMGIVLISFVAWFWFRQTLDFAALLGLGLIVAGVIIVNVFSKSVSH